MKATIKYDEMFIECELRAIDMYYVSVRVYKDEPFFRNALESFVNNNESVTFNDKHIFVCIRRENVKDITINE